MTTRFTNQRMKILDYLKSVKTHPNAETVYNHVRKELPRITLATVYRNLNLMADQGIILRLQVDKEYRYDACIDKHQHCVCEQCGLIIDTHQPEITDYVLSKIDAKNFKPASAIILVQGLCDKCAEVN